ncbi:MAG: zinc ABC transporter substrate-binding protein [Pseudomonadota bacterium]
MFRLLAPFALASLALPAGAEVPRVVTDIPAVHSLVWQVMEGVGEPVLLVSPGADAHSFQMRPSQAAALAEADLVVWLGPEMTPWLERILGTEAPGSDLRLLDAPGATILGYGEGNGDAKAAGSGSSDAPGGRDPHAWLDPSNAALWIDAIAARLGRTDPDNAAVYARNAAAARVRIEALDLSLTDRLATVKGVPFAVYHDAYGYFVRRYGLTVVGSIAGGDAREPGAARLEELRGALVGARCIFPEAGRNEQPAETVASDGAVTLGEPLDPEGSALTPGPDLYADLMTGLADRLLACLGTP